MVHLTGAVEDRYYCPMCDREMELQTCPDDGISGLPLYSDPQSIALREGVIIADRYRLERPLATGGMGTIYAATQLSMQREIAVKVLRQDLAMNRQRLRRFALEANAARALKHPNIVEIYDFGVDKITHTPFLAMQLVEGASLRRLLPDDGLRCERACELLSQIARALTAAHALGLVHRDLKPDNAMVTPLADGGEHVTVLDFGVVKDTTTKRGDARLTQTGSSVGTPAYMSPEQCVDGPIDARTDLYALGCMLHEALTGDVPFSESIGKLMYHHQYTAPPLLDARYPEPLRALHASLLAKSPSRRPRSARDVAHVLSMLARGQRDFDIRAMLPADEEEAAAPTFVKQQTETVTPHESAVSEVDSPATHQESRDSNQILFLEGSRKALEQANPQLSRNHGRNNHESPVGKNAMHWPTFRVGKAAAWATAGIVGVVVVLWGIGSGWFVNPSQTSRLLTVPEHPIVAVAPFINRSGNPDYDRLGDSLANLIRDGLSESRGLVVVSQMRWAALTSTTSDGFSSLESARAAGIQYVVNSDLLQAPNGLVLSTRVTDVSAGVDLAARTLRELEPNQVLGSANRLTFMVKTALRVPHTQAVDTFAADFAVENVAAYEAYVAGLGFFVDFKLDQAIAALNSALHLAPDFHIARLRLAQIEAATGLVDQALQTIDGIPKDAHLTRRERLYVEGVRALFGRDLARAQEVFKALLKDYPFDVEAKMFLAESHWHKFEDEQAIRVLRGLLRQEPENLVARGTLAKYLIVSGQLNEGEIIAFKYKELAPRSAHPIEMLAEIAMLRGRFDSAIELYREALKIDPSFQLARLGLAQSFAADGQSPKAEAAFRQIVSDITFESEHRITAAFNLADLMRGSGRFAESISVLEQVDDMVRSEQVRESKSLAVRGLSMIELNDYEAAGRLIASAIKRSPGVRPPTRYLFARALLELALKKMERVTATVAEIRRHVSSGGQQ